MILPLKVYSLICFDVNSCFYWPSKMAFYRIFHFFIFYRQISLISFDSYFSMFKHLNIIRACANCRKVACPWKLRPFNNSEIGKQKTAWLESSDSCSACDTSPSIEIFVPGFFSYYCRLWVVFRLTTISSSPLHSSIDSEDDSKLVQSLSSISHIFNDGVIDLHDSSLIISSVMWSVISLK